MSVSFYYPGYKINRYEIPRRIRQYTPDRTIRDALFLAFDKSFSSTIKAGKHCAVLLNKNKEIIKTFVNCRKECPKMGTIHAEVGVIESVKNDYPNINLSECILLVVRGNRIGQFSNSAPCDECFKYMKKHNVGMILYTAGDNEICVVN